MKIAVDISQIIYGTGVSVYTKNLLINLLKIDKENEYILLGLSLRRQNEIKDFVSSLKSYKGKVSSKIFPIAPKLADVTWNKLHLLSVENLTGSVDVFHSSDWTQPPSKAFKVTTVHDLAPILFPEFTDPTVVSVHKRRLAWVKKEVDRIIVPTISIKNDLISEGFKEEKIRVIYEGVGDIFKPSEQTKINSLKNKFGIDGKYLLAIGVNKRKNIERIIKALGEIKTKDLKLVVVGHKYFDVKATDVIFVGHVEDYELPILLSGSEALVYPSLYEGFGLPILEAFACNCPVVTSNLGSMKEVAGDAAILVDPYDVESITEGIKKAIKNRAALIGKGKEILKAFSWESAAEETLKIYREAASSAYKEAF